jgi:hypothetical protein
MFQRDTSNPPRLHVVEGARERSQTKGVRTMNAYEFAESSVATGVTLLVSAWFLVAAGAILADPSSPYTQRPVAQAAAQASASIVVAENQAPTLVPVANVVAAPDARFTITVQAKRLKV